MSLTLPEGFTDLYDVDPTIAQSVRYCSHENFLGRPAVGYEKPKIILTRLAAETLKRIQEKVKSYGYSLLIYDGYRPQQTVDSWAIWSQDPLDQAAQASYYPTLTKTEIFNQGYIVKKSSHSRGSTVDLSLILLGRSVHPPVLSFRKLKNGEEIPYLDDGSVDMGSHFDLFHQVSHHDSSQLTQAATEKRDFLRWVMTAHGFKEFPTEWWHYTLQEEPYPGTYFNFVIQ